MPEQGDPPVCAGQRAGEADDAFDRAEQRREQRFMFMQTARQGLRMPAVTGKVEGDRDHAVARGSRRERLHQLLRAGKPMRDDDDRTCPVAAVGDCGAGRPEHRDRDRVDVAASDFQPLAGGLEGAQRLAGQQQRGQREQHDAQGGRQRAHGCLQPIRAARGQCRRRPAPTDR